MASSNLGGFRVRERIRKAKTLMEIRDLYNEIILHKSAPIATRQGWKRLLVRRETAILPQIRERIRNAQTLMEFCDLSIEIMLCESASVKMKREWEKLLTERKAAILTQKEPQHIS